MRSLLEGRFKNIERDLFLDPAARLVEQALLDLASDARARAEAPGVEALAADYLAVRESASPLDRECALIGLYNALHGAGSAYTPAERDALDRARGISCHPGGLAPLLLAEALIGPEAVTADLGAGNGLQGLLLQRIRPHKRTLLVELSSEMLRVGSVFQEALRVDEGRVEWLNRDILSAPLEEADFVYLYRPAKPVGAGRDLYVRLAGRLCKAKDGLVVLSVADCLGRHIGGRFGVIYENEHMAIFRKGRP